MQAIKGHYRMGQVQLLEPLVNVTEADLYIIVLDNEDGGAQAGNPVQSARQLDEEAVSNLKLQSQSYFAQNVLLDPAEDVWNDL